MGAYTGYTAKTVLTLLWSIFDKISVPAKTIFTTLVA